MSASRWEWPTSRTAARSIDSSSHVSWPNFTGEGRPDSVCPSLETMKLKSHGARPRPRHRFASRPGLDRQSGRSGRVFQSPLVRIHRAAARRAQRRGLAVCRSSGRSASIAGRLAFVSRVRTAGRGAGTPATLRRRVSMVPVSCQRDARPGRVDSQMARRAIRTSKTAYVPRKRWRPVSASCARSSTRFRRWHGLLVRTALATSSISAGSITRA